MKSNVPIKTLNKTGETATHLDEDKLQHLQLNHTVETATDLDEIELVESEQQDELVLGVSVVHGVLQNAHYLRALLLGEDRVLQRVFPLVMTNRPSLVPIYMLSRRSDMRESMHKEESRVPNCHH